MAKAAFRFKRINVEVWRQESRVWESFHRTSRNEFAVENQVADRGLQTRDSRLF
jgi:hypothetical protein